MEKLLTVIVTFHLQQGCGKSVLVHQFSKLLGYQIEPIVLYQVLLCWYSFLPVVVVHNKRSDWSIPVQDQSIPYGNFPAVAVCYFIRLVVLFYKTSTKWFTVKVTVIQTLAKPYIRDTRPATSHMFGSQYPPRKTIWYFFNTVIIAWLVM